MPQQAGIDKIAHKIKHFKYELTRNPMGLLAHCAELIIKA
jgi:hypothetical protein